MNNNYTCCESPGDQNIEFKTELTKNKEHKKTKSSNLKELVENAESYMSVLNKMMTTHKQCIKYEFMAPINLIFICRAKEIFSIHEQFMK